MDEQATKRAARRSAREARDALDDETRASAAARIRARLAALEEVRGAATIVAYAATGSEVDLDPLLEVLLGRDVAVYLPVVDGPELTLARVHDLTSDLAAGYRGVREPSPDLPRESAPAVDVVLVPGVGFAPDGTRIGYGGGHFDRLLTRLEAPTRIGVAYAAQVLPHLPTENHDQRLDAVVTETGVLRPSD
ncbi:5-formyltetrahydrofolate cyclo-ligase [Egibacter rhizosphaerae]|uniref:5-formyltetrahydrofolate cyclo-ligase n=1 Tax=Egibacter rhizosphaerae TaxID=1670831 RepID=UPI0013F173E1|nr:5-formyltetrahydrofolate cyclo-ligase [Egibacter rhizosphaerae]